MHIYTCTCISVLFWWFVVFVCRCVRALCERKKSRRARRDSRAWESYRFASYAQWQCSHIVSGLFQLSSFQFIKDISLVLCVSRQSTTLRYIIIYRRERKISGKSTIQIYRFRERKERARIRSFFFNLRFLFTRSSFDIAVSVCVVLFIIIIIVRHSVSQRRRCNVFSILILVHQFGVEFSSCDLVTFRLGKVMQYTSFTQPMYF